MYLQITILKLQTC